MTAVVNLCGNDPTIIRSKLLDSGVKEDIAILSTKWHANGEGCGNCCDSGDDDTHTTAN
jgi:hypothetical protein